MKKTNKIFLPVVAMAISALMTMMSVSCATGSRSSAGGEVTGVGGTSWAEPTPYGMVLVNRG